MPELTKEQIDQFKKQARELVKKHGYRNGDTLGSKQTGRLASAFMWAFITVQCEGDPDEIFSSELYPYSGIHDIQKAERVVENDQKTT